MKMLICAIAAVALVVGLLAWPGSAAEQEPSCPCRSESKAQQVGVTLDVPSTLWTLKIVEARLKDGKIRVLAQLSAAEGMMGAQVITTRKDQVTITAPAMPIEIYIAGKGWNWNQKTDYTFIKDRAAIAEKLDGGIKLALDR